MKNNKVVQAINKIIPDENKQKYLFQKIIEKSQVNHMKTRQHLLKRILPVAVCFIMPLAGVLTYSLWNKSIPIPVEKPSQNRQASSSDSTRSKDKDIKGLPVEDFSVQKLTLDVAMCRAIAWRCLPDFFVKNRNIRGDWETGAFIVAKVTDVQTEPSSDYSLRRQVSTVKVLQHVFGKKTPKSFQIVQTNYTGTTIGPTNMLREKGVYVLPIRVYDISDINMEKFMDEEYCIDGDLDVLFEIDNNGLVYSHSDFEDFKWFDGKPYATLTDAISNIAKSPDLKLMTSAFGITVLTEKFAQAEIVSKAPKDEYDTSGDLNYNTRIMYDFKNSKQEEVYLSYNFLDNVPVKKASLHQGSRYLMFGHLDRGYKGHNKFFVWRDYVAEIRPDNTIRPVSDKSIFLDYNGFTVDEVRDLIERINAYKSS